MFMLIEVSLVPRDIIYRITTLLDFEDLFFFSIKTPRIPNAQTGSENVQFFSWIGTTVMVSGHLESTIPSFDNKKAASLSQNGQTRNLVGKLFAHICPLCCCQCVIHCFLIAVYLLFVNFCDVILAEGD